MKLLICTNNENKIKEIKQALALMPINIITLFDLKDDFNVKETGSTFQENALMKAKYFGDKYQMLSLADDTGLEVAYLNGGPGVYTKRYEKTAERRNQKLLKELKGITNRKANFKTVLCLYNPQTNKEFYFTGTVNGEIAETPRGEEGFGYDPIFYLNNLNKTMAELTLEEKNEISHRGLAIKKLKEFLDENINNL